METGIINISFKRNLLWSRDGKWECVVWYGAIRLGRLLSAYRKYSVFRSFTLPFIIFLMLWTECLFIHKNLYIETLISQCEGIWRLGLWEINTLRWWVLCPNKSQQNVCFLSALYHGRCPTATTKTDLTLQLHNGLLAYSICAISKQSEDTR